MNIPRFQDCELRLDEINTEVEVFHLADPRIRYKILDIRWHALYYGFNHYILRLNPVCPGLYE